MDILLFTIVKLPGAVTLADMTMHIGPEGGSIGRGKNNRWALPDPERFLSSVHMEIVVKDGQYFVLDHSTNGTFHNQSMTPIGKGIEIPLADGDSLKLGDYEIQVSMLETSHASGSHSSDSSPGPFAAHHLTESNNNSDSVPGISNSPVNQNIPADKINYIPSPEPLFNEQAILDPLIAFSVSESIEPPIMGTQGDSDNILHHSIAMPELIPDDWDLAPSSVSSQPDSKMPINDLNSRKDAATGKVDNSDSDDECPDSSHKIISHAEVKSEQVIAKKSTKSCSAIDSPSSVYKPNLSNKQSYAGSDKTRSTPANADLIAAMGLNIHELNQEQINNINSIIGDFVQETVKGLMLILNSRSSIKNEFRMSVTTIQSVENNPLKFSPNVEDAMINMFIKTGSAYKDPVSSVKEGIESIADHQLSVFAGMRSAFNYFLERFNPELLEAKFNKQKGSVLATKKARNWELYTEFYQDLIKDRDDSFQYLFGDDFVHTYEKQMQKLKLSRSQ